MLATLLGKGFTKFINFLRRGNLNGIKINRENEYDLGNNNLDKSNILEKECTTNNDSPGSNKNSIHLNNLNFTPYYTDSPKENRLHAKKIISNFKHKYTYMNELRKFYLNPSNKIREASGLNNKSEIFIENINNQISLVPNQIENRIFNFQKSANNPIEDRINSIQLQNLEGYFVSVLDGHGGEFVAEYANLNLHLKFEERINQRKQESENFIEEEDIRNALNYAFDQIVKIININTYYNNTFDIIT